MTADQANVLTDKLRRQHRATGGRRGRPRQKRVDRLIAAVEEYNRLVAQTDWTITERKRLAQLGSLLARARGYMCDDPDEFVTRRGVKIRQEQLPLDVSAGYAAYRDDRIEPEIGDTFQLGDLPYDYSLVG